MSKLMKRDDFTEVVKDRLRKRVAYRCSNPNCRVATISASSASYISTKTIGVAAHINAASKGGPRYDADMTTLERKSIENAIWLCANCSRDIDSDPIKYTKSLLLKWKDFAENQSINELGKKLPSNTETIETLTTAFTGVSNTYLNNAIPNVHSASSNVLEKLDPRLSIKTSFDDGITTYKISAKEDISLTVKPKFNVDDEYKKKLGELIKHGLDVNFASGSLSIVGSKFFEETFNKEQGSITISKSKIPAIQKIYLKENKDVVSEHFEDIDGYISHGTDTYSFDGSIFNNIFRFSYQKSIVNEEPNINYNFQLDFEQWNGLDINSLPFFEKLRIFFSKIANGWSLDTSLEINGNLILKGSSDNFQKSDFFKNNHQHFQYLHSIATISQFLKIPIKFKAAYSYTIDEYVRVLNIANAIHHKEMNISNTQMGNFTTNIKISTSNIQLLKDLRKPTSLQIVENNNEEIKVFNTMLRLPQKTITITNVIASFNEAITLDNLKIGDVVSIEWMPLENFTYAEFYKTE